MSTPRPEWLEDHKKRIHELYEHVVSYAQEELALEDACNILVDLSNMKTSMALIYDEMLKKVSDLMEEEPLIQVESGHSIEKKWSKDRRGWRHKELAEVVASRVTQMSIDMDTGERLMSHEEIARRMLDFVQPSYWRVSALEEIGVVADEYCTVGDTKASVVVRKPKNNTAK
jgi:hypothetical protein